MKRIVHIVSAFLVLMLLNVAVYASDTQTSQERLSTRLFDAADLLSDSDEAYILARLDEVSEKYSFDLVIVTVKDIGMTSAEAYADDFFDYGGYGYGDSHDGAILLIASESRKVAISTCGSGLEIISDDRIDGFWGSLTNYLSNSNWDSACKLFISKCEYYLEGEMNGFPFDSGRAILFSLVASIVVAWLVGAYHKGQLKSVVAKHNAAGYVRDGSMNLTSENDIFLYRNVTRTRKQSSSSSGGSHRSSSGRSHGGRSGSF